MKHSEKSLGGIFFILMAVFCLILVMARTFDKVYADDIGENTKTKITDFSITRTNGTIPPNGFFLNENIKLNINWDASHYGNSLKEGDYFKIKLPKAFKIINSAGNTNFPIKSADGSIIANVNVKIGENGAGGEIKVVFTKYVEGKYHIKGNISLISRLNTEVVTPNQENTFEISVGSYFSTVTIPVLPGSGGEVKDEILNKWSHSTLTREGHVTWVLRINHKKGTLNNVTISDQLSSSSGSISGIGYVPDSFILKEVEMNERGEIVNIISQKNVSRQVQFNADRTQFTYYMGKIEGKQYRLYYRSTFKPGIKLHNKAKLESSEKSKQVISQFGEISGSGEGGSGLAKRMRLIKADAEDDSILLKGAVFDVTAPDGGKFELTTDDDGVVTSGILSPGKYRVKEKKAPLGYELSNEEYTMEVSDTEGAVKKILNKKSVPPDPKPDPKPNPDPKPGSKPNPDPKIVSDSKPAVLTSENKSDGKPSSTAKTSSHAKKKNTDTHNPKTGDKTNLYLYLIVAVISTMLFAVVYSRRRVDHKQ